jgi:hypothetical protein
MATVDNALEQAAMPAEGNLWFQTGTIPIFKTYERIMEIDSTERRC